MKELKRTHSGKRDEALPNNNLGDTNNIRRNIDQKSERSQ